MILRRSFDPPLFAGPRESPHLSRSRTNLRQQRRSSPLPSASRDLRQQSLNLQLT
jgi:hypothetical protein